MVAFEPFTEEPSAEIRILERDDAYLDADFVEAVGFVGEFRVFRYGGTIVDSLSPSRGLPGECLQINAGDGGIGNCRATPADDDDEPWLLYTRASRAPFVVWSGLDSSVVRVTVVHEDGTVSVQTPLSGIVLVPVTPYEVLEAVAERDDGQLVPLRTE